MRILVVSIEFGPPFQRDLMNALAARGHEVTFYSAALSDFSRRLKLQWSRRDGIDRAELWNSPVKPSVSDDPRVQIGSAAIDAITESVLDKVRPDVVHVHELSGHGLSVLDVVNRRGIPCVVSFHNFWPVCPQLNLIDAAGELCLDDAEGAKCARCRWLPTAKERTHIESMKSVFRSTPLFGPLRRIRRILRHSVANVSGSVAPVGWSEAEFPAEAFAERRRRAVAALNGGTLVHAMSTSSARVLEGRGVSPSRIRIRPISLYSLGSLRPLAHKPASHLVTFGYRGALSYVKGLHVLVAAFARLDQSRARLLIYGAGEPRYERGLRDLAKSLNVEFRGEYKREDLPAIDAEIDVGVVPSIWDETFCLTGLEFLRSGVPVIAAQIGGMADYVRHSVNGILVPPDDVGALAAAMGSLVDAPAEIEALRVQLPSASMDQVADSMVDLFQEARVSQA